MTAGKMMAITFCLAVTLYTMAYYVVTVLVITLIESSQLYFH